MYLIIKDLNRLIQWRKSRFKIILVELWNINCIIFVIRFWLMGVKDQFEYLQDKLTGTFFDLFFNLGQFNSLYFVVGFLSLFGLLNTKHIFHKSDIRVWNPLLNVLTNINWSQFVEYNLDFEPTFSLIKFSQNPILTLKRWRIVFSKLRNHRQVHFAYPPKLFPYMNRKIRIKILYTSLIYSAFLKSFHYATSRFPLFCLLILIF